MKEHTFACVMVVVVAVLGSTVIAMAEKTATKTDGDSIKTVLLQLQQDKDAFQQFWDAHMTPRMQKLLQKLAANIAQASQLQKQLAKNQTSKKLAAQYEDVLSTALLQVSTFLREFQGNRKETFTSLDQVEQTVGKAQKTFERVGTKKRQQAGKFQLKANQVQGKLQEMAKSLELDLRQGKKLSPELNTMVKCLAADRKNFLLNQKVAELAAANACRSAKVLAQQRKHLGRVRGDLQSVFADADGQRVLVANLAELRKQGLLTQELTESLRAVHEIHRLRTDGVHGVALSLEKVMAQCFRGIRLTDGKVPSIHEDQSGRDILLRLLPRTKKGKTE